MIKKIIGIFKHSDKQDRELEVTNLRIESLIARLNGEESWFLEEVDKCIKECLCKVDKKEKGGDSAVPI